MKKSSILLILSLGLLALWGVRTISNSDIWMHLATGRQIAEHGIPEHDPFSYTLAADQKWINDSWLYDCLLFRLWQFGSAPVVTGFHVMLVIAAFLVLLPVANRFGRSAGTAFALVLCGWLMAPRFVVNPSLFGLFFVSLFVALFSGEKFEKTRWWLLLPTQTLWTNMHASFLLGPLIGTLFCVERYLERRLTKAMIIGACGLWGVTLLNPYGPDLLKHAARLAVDAHYNVLLEWISPFSTLFATRITSILMGIVLVSVAAGFVTMKTRLPVSVTTLAVLGAYLLVRSSRYVDLCAVLLFPFLSWSLLSLGSYIQQKTPNTRQKIFPFAVNAAFLFVVAASAFLIISNVYYGRTGHVSTFGVGVEHDLFPGERVQKLLRHPSFPQAAINLSVDGGYLAWTLPERKIFTDSRGPLYGASFYQMLGKGLSGHIETWKRVEELWQPEAVLLNATWPGSGTALRHLLTSGKWAWIFFDGTTVVLVTTESKHDVFTKDTTLQKDGLEAIETARRTYERLVGGWMKPGNPPQLLGAGHIFQALGRFKESAAIYRLLVRGAPNFLPAWLNLGICEVQLEQHQQAVKTLSYAAKMMPGNALTWLWLSRALEKNGQHEASGQAYSKAVSINPQLMKTSSTTDQTSRPPMLLQENSK